MYKLIIIDDEYTVALELSDFLDYSEYGFEVAGVFSEPREALSFIENNKVDLILSDIKMVGVTGIDILKTVNKEQPETLVVLISAYRDFSYAKEAITHNAFEYLTKPILYGEFTSMLKKAEERLKRNEVDTNDGAEDMMLQSEIYDYFNNIVSMDGINDFLKKYSPYINLQKSECSMLEISVVNIDEYIALKWKYGKYRLCSAIRQIIPTKINDILFLCMSSLSKSVKFITIDLGVDNMYNQRLERSADYIRQKLNSILDIDTDIKLKISADSIDHMYNIIANTSRESVDSIVSNILNNDFGNADIILEKYFAEHSAEEISLLVNQLMAVLKENDSKIGMEMLDEIGLKCLNNSEFILTYCKEILYRYKNGEESRGKNVTLKALVYMSTHYSEDITLDSIAAYVNLSPTYFSYYFKKETGEKYSSYLLKIRMERAKQILKENPDIKNDTIAEKIGYRSTPHFYKAFQAYTGFSPNEFKRRG